MAGHTSRDVVDILTGWLAAVATVAAVATLVVPGVLRGTAVMNGSARGTAVGVVLAVVVLRVGRVSTRRTWFWGPLLRLGATWYLLYNAVLLAFATPYNRLFLPYVATLGLAIFAGVEQMRRIRPDDERYRPPTSVRWVSVYILVVAVLNVLMWLGRVLPGTVTGDHAVLRGTGLTTNPVIVQDLAFWLPLAVVIGVLLRRGSVTGGWLAGALLVFWLLEAVGVTLDQWLGHRADPSSSVATLGGAYLFTAMAVLGACVLVLYLRALAVRPRPRPRGGVGTADESPDEAAVPPSVGSPHGRAARPHGAGAGRGVTTG